MPVSSRDAQLVPHACNNADMYNAVLQHCTAVLVAWSCVGTQHGGMRTVVAGAGPDEQELLLQGLLDKVGRVAAAGLRIPSAC